MHLSSIHIYPVKSCAGISLGEGRVERRGLAFDRRWMVVDGEGTFLTQRRFPRMALVQVGLEADGLRLDAPGMEPLRVDAEARGEPLRVRVWQDVVDAVAAGPAADAWLSRFLEHPCRLVRMPEEAVRPVNPAYAVRPDDEVSFADGYPLLLISEASLDDLNRRLETPVPMDRFRPNLVVAGCGAFAEDGWRTVRIGSVRFHVVKPSERCAVVTVDQDTGVPGKEPLRTLARYRKQGDKTLFGQNLIPESPGLVRPGDPVVPEARSAEFESAEW